MWIVAGALALVSALAWIYILVLAAAMPRTMPHAMAAMPAMAMMPGAASWTLLQAALVFAMWAVMMVGMMTPSAAPMILLYAGVGRQAQSRGAAFASAAWFALGYLAAWTAFAAAATAAQAALAAHALLSPAMALTSRPLGALVLLAAGAYQLLPVKQACLAHCRAPLQFIQHHGGYPADRRGALRLGLAHGWYCVGCCWVLMALLFVAGVMNTLWIAALSILVLAEKAVPGGRHVARTTGAAALAAGVWMLLA